MGPQAMTKKASGYLIDSDVLIDFLRGVSEARSFISASQRALISVVSVAELCAGTSTAAELQNVERMLSLFEIVAATTEIAKTAGAFKRQFGPSHGVGMADALIAATAQHSNAVLATRNKKHFPMLSNIIVPYSLQ